jgi:hypothetical protein
MVAHRTAQVSHAPQMANPTRPLGSPLMRRLVPLLLAALLALAVSTPVAAGGRPEKSNNDPIIQGADVFAGTCAFPVQLEDHFASSRNFLFPVADDGSQRLSIAGGYKSTFTNLDEPEKTLDLTFFGHLELTFNPDGTTTLRGGGQVILWTADPVDAAMYGVEPGIYFIKGRIEAVVDENFIAIEPAKVRGTVTDICALLA